MSRFGGHFKKGAFARQRRRREGEMNQTEQRYAQYLNQQVAAGNVLGWWFEGMKARLADNTFYTPDFMVQMANGEVQFHEVKGTYWMDDARVKVKVMAECLPFTVLFCVVEHKRGTTHITIEAVGRHETPPADRPAALFGRPGTRDTGGTP